MKADKTPATPRGFKDASSDPDLIGQLFNGAPGIGIATGASGLLVLDVDPGHGGDDSLADLEAEHGELPETIRVVTGGGGAHYYFANPNGTGCSAGKLGPGLDIRAEGGYVVAPPSPHPSGRVYEWDVSPDEADPAAPPGWLVDLLGKRGEQRTRGEEPGSAIPAGKRNETLTSLAGSMRRRGMDEPEIAAALRETNKRCSPPLEAAEVDAIAASVAGYEPAAEEPDKKSQATRLVELAQAAGDELFSADQVAYARVAVDAHLEVHALRSRGYRSRLARRMFEAENKAPGSQATQDAISVLEGEALYAGGEHPVHVRLAEHEGAIYLDLGSSDWRAVEISAEGWQIVAAPPVRFRRPKGLAEIPEPVAGDLGALAANINVAPEDWPLVVGWLLATLRPTGPYPVLALHGEHGSAKSTTARMLRSLIDPRTEMLRSPPRSEHDLVIGANNGWIVGFDNLSTIPPWLSDGLCRLATGGGFATRTLYADDEETIFSATRPILVNGIGEIATRGDLVDRTIMVEVPRIAETQRIAEGEVWAAFNAARPAILGALLDAVAVGLRDVGNVRLDELPRMADFATWAAASLPGAGIGSDIFLARYSANRAAGTSAVLEDSPLAGALLKLAAAGFEGSASELLEQLGDLASETDLRSRDWPKGAAALGRVLARLAPTLRDSGVLIEHDRDKRRRTWQIRMDVQSAVIAVTPSPMACSSGATDDSNGDSKTAGDSNAVTDDSNAEAEKRLEQAEGDGNDGNDSKSRPYSNSRPHEENTP